MHISYKCCLSLKHFSYMKKNLNFDFMYCIVYIFSISMQPTKYKIQKASQHEVEQLDLYFIHSVSLFLLEIIKLLHKCKQNVRKLQCQLLLTTRNKASLMLWAEPFFLIGEGGGVIYFVQNLYSVFIVARLKELMWYQGVARDYFMEAHGTPPHHSRSTHATCMQKPLEERSVFPDASE